MNHHAISITGVGSLSAAGSSWSEVQAFYERGASAVIQLERERGPFWGAPLSAAAERRCTEALAGIALIDNADRSARLAAAAALQAVDTAGWRAGDRRRIAVNLGCSRGATGALEGYHKNFLENPGARTAVLASPVTTGGNLTSAVVQSLLVREQIDSGFDFSHSATCSSALLSIGNALAWLRAGMVERFIAGGAEAPLTGFTLAQMRALRIYTQGAGSDLPCRPCAIDQTASGMVLGEGASVFCLERTATIDSEDKSLARILGFGSASEKLASYTAISPDGANFREAMRQALLELPEGRQVDLVIMHAPGTALGDRAEHAALQATFRERMPILLSNKWLVGHTLGASGALSIEYALHILLTGRYTDFPYPVPFQNRACEVRTVMINSAGFGGNAATLILGL